MSACPLVIGIFYPNLHDIIQHPDFSVEGLADFDAGRATKQVDIDAHASFPILADSKETSVNIEVPSGSTTVASRVFPVPGLYYGSLVSVIKSAFADPLS
jgi:effector-binding domain-containing protein